MKNKLLWKSYDDPLMETILWNFFKNSLAGHLYSEDVWEDNFSLLWYVDDAASDEDVQDAWININ